MRVRRCIAPAALALWLAGCTSLPPATTAVLTYDTVPEGATLFEGGQSLGPAPVTRTYRQVGTETTLRTPEVTAVWPSGAKTGFYTFLPLGADRVATLERPKDVPGLDADLDHARKVVAARQGDTKRTQDAIQRDMARSSDRCKAQMSKGGLASNDC